MLNLDYLYVPSALLDLREYDQAKNVMARILAMADISELWTIARCAAILDSSTKLAVGKAKLDRFARELGDEHRAELVRFCRDQTGRRPRRTTVTLPEPKNPLSIHHDTRPGFEDSDAQPAGLVVRPDEYEQRRQQRQANTLAELTRSLRHSVRQLPPHIRTALKDMDTTRISRRAPRSRAQQRLAERTRRMERLADDYIRTRLGVEDHTAYGLRTIFDVDDDNHRRPVALNVMAQGIARIRAEIQARKTAENPDTARAEATPDTTNRRSTEIHDPDDDPTAPIPGYEFDYTKAAQHPIRTTPCVACWTERRPQDARTIAHTNGYDDSLCGECRTNGYAGLPKPRPVRVRCTVAYLNPADRAQALADAARTAAITTPCATAAANLPKGAALVWIRAHRALASETQRPTIDGWVLAWLNSAQPQPPTPAPAAAAIPATVIRTSRRYQRRHGHALPANTVYVGRPTPFGNPFRCAPTPAARAEAVRQYRQWISTQPELIEQARAELTSRTLACWCPTDGPCHADVLLEIIDAPVTPTQPARALAAA